MRLIEPLANHLRLLNEALDDSVPIDGASTRLWYDARSAVPSFSGLTVSVPGVEAPFAFTALREGARAQDIRTSLLIACPLRSTPGLTVAIVLRAEVPGAFVDLAADLAWLSGRDIIDYVLDQHVEPPAVQTTIDVFGAKVINQAIGVLVGRGYTMREAGAFLDAGGGDRLAAAQAVLDGLDGSSCDRSGPDRHEFADTDGTDPDEAT